MEYDYNLHFPMPCHRTARQDGNQSIINRLRATFFIGNMKMYLLFTSLLHTDMTKVVEVCPNVRHELNILHSQYIGCWSLGVSNNDFEYFEPE